MTNTFDFCLFEVKSSQFEGIDFMDEHEDIYSIHDRHGAFTIEICQDVLMDCYKNIVHLEDSIYDISDSLDDKMSSLKELCSITVIETLLNCRKHVMGGIQNLPLPVLYRANVEGHYLHMRRGARTVPPLLIRMIYGDSNWSTRVRCSYGDSNWSTRVRCSYGDSNWSTRVRCSPEPGRGTWGAGFWCAVI